MLNVKLYKPGQAKASRTSVFLTGLFLILWGCQSLIFSLPILWVKLGDSVDVLFGSALPDEGLTVDLLLFKTPVNLAFVIAVVVAVVGSAWWWLFLNKAKWADLLIEMELELKKVSWPTPGDAWQSTLVVTAFTVILVAAMFFYDVVIRGVLQLVTG